MRGLRRSILMLVVLIAGWLQLIVYARSEVPARAIANPNELVQGIVFALQSGDKKLLYDWLGSELLNEILARTGGTGRDLRLLELGPVSSVDAKQLLTSLGQTSFTARVTHPKGLSSWTLSLDNATHRIVTAKYQISFSNVSVENAPPGGGPAARDDDKIIQAAEEAASKERARQSDHARFEAERRRDASETWAGTSPNLPPTSRLPAPLPAPSAQPSALDSRVVDFLYVTTRRPSDQNGGRSISYTGERSPELNFGAASVHIPKDHKIGRIELPFKWSFFGYTVYEGSFSEDKHFAIRQIGPLTPEQWGKIATAKSAQKQALIFLHGYNTSFEDALYRNAQIVWDLQYPGLSVLFSWASAGNAGDYFYDRDSAYLARGGFVKVLSLLRETYHFEKVDVIAHSMGNLVVLDALSNYARTSNPVKIGQLIMAAPDVDRDQFLQMEPDVRKITSGMTLYASSADKALALSRVPARVPRAGDVPSDGPIVLPDMETIDVTAIGDEIFGLNHTEFATNRAIIDDIKLLISTGMRPPRLAQIRGIPDLPAIPKYWRYVP